MGRGTAILLTASLAAGCAPTDAAAPRDRTWLGAAATARDSVLVRHLRGLDVAMIEIDYRHAELYFAGQEENWPYAEYQVTKLRLAMDLALERRPARAASARAFFYPQLERVEAAVRAGDAAAFAQRWEAFAHACGDCHVAEQVPSFGVRIPPERRSSITRR